MIAHYQSTSMLPLYVKPVTSTYELYDTSEMLSPMTPTRSLPALSSAPVSTMLTLYSSAHQHLTLPNSNGSRTCWRVSSRVNTDGLEHFNLLLLFIGCQSSLEFISRSPQLPTNSSRTVNLPAWPTQYLDMFLVAQ